MTREGTKLNLLQRRDAQIASMANDIKGLNNEIEETNRGLMAIHKELEVRGVDLEVARRQLAVSEKLAALGSLVSGVAHEVRTPLTIIAINLHILNGRAAKAARSGDYTALADQVPRVTSEVLIAIERVQELVKGLSRFSQTKSVTVETLLDPIVREAIDLYASVNRSRTSVTVDLDAPRLVLVDRSKIQQVVINLVENAVQASHLSGEGVIVRTYTDADGAGTVLSVEDHGCGMTQDTQARMFEPLFTTKPEGTGVGLTIVERIAREHGAPITCDSEIGRGTTLAIHFPGPRTDPGPTHLLTDAPPSSARGRDALPPRQRAGERRAPERRR